MGAAWGDSSADKDFSELHPRLQAPNVFVVISSLVCMYVGISCMLTFSLGASSLVSSVVLVLLVAIVIVEPFERNYPSTHWLMVICVVTAASASVVGISSYHGLYAHALAAESGRVYTDVSPMAKASAHADGGTIGFTSTAFVDETRAIGLLRFGRTYCVAPIVAHEASVSPTSAMPTVQFWAVGTDCCRKRSSFDCDDTGDLEARGGIVLHEGEEAVTSSFLAPHLHEPEFLRAIQASSALFEVKTADAPVLVRWVKDPKEKIKVWQEGASFVWLTSSIIYCVVISVVWCVIHQSYDKKIRQAVEVLNDGQSGARLAGAAAGVATATGSRPLKDPFLLGTGTGGGASAKNI